MQRFVQAPNLVVATLWVNWLRAEGIGASVQREFLRIASGELPPDQCLPEVWIDDGHVDDAGGTAAAVVASRSTTNAVGRVIGPHLNVKT
jgi:hypothetical protein